MWRRPNSWSVIFVKVSRGLWWTFQSHLNFRLRVLVVYTTFLIILKPWLKWWLRAAGVGGERRKCWASYRTLEEGQCVCVCVFRVWKTYWLHSILQLTARKGLSSRDLCITMPLPIPKIRKSKVNITLPECLQRPSCKEKHQVEDASSKITLAQYGSPRDSRALLMVSAGTSLPSTECFWLKTNKPANERHEVSCELGGRSCWACSPNTENALAVCHVCCIHTIPTLTGHSTSCGCCYPRHWG